ncbi:MgtC/SapB family protein [Longispora sp. K20-0274]|uniref:hypothetical protein n=1 Tax=Longispora sp. K20-0274 TaxID=3088255 RepID=UPI00399A40EE
MTDPTWWPLPARLGTALGLGIAIGLERQWRSRSAGLRRRAPPAGTATTCCAPCAGTRTRRRSAPLLVHALPADLFTLHEVRSHDLEDTGRAEVTARPTATVSDPGQLEDAVSMLSLQPGITAVSWQFVSREPDDEDDV